MEFMNNAVIHKEDCGIPRIKEEHLSPDEITNKSQQFETYFQESDVDTKVGILQETWDSDVASRDFKSNPKPHSMCLSTGAIKGDDEIDNKEHNQDELLPESQKFNSQPNEIYFMEYNESSDNETKVGIKQESLDPIGISNDIKCDPEQPPTLDLGSFLDTGIIEGEDEIDTKEELWGCEETSNSVNEREGSGSKKNEAAEVVPLLQTLRAYADTLYSCSTTQQLQNTNASTWCAKSHTPAEKCETKHICKTCGKRFELLSNLKKHNLVPNECKWRKCEKNCTYSAIVENCVIHNKRRQYFCGTCGKTFLRLVYYNEHLLVHDVKRQYKCEICEKAFKQLRYLKRHLLVHQDKYQYKCEICEKSFKQLPLLKSHLLVHDDKRQFKCHVCGKSFNQLPGLRSHLLVHDDKKQYKCKVCEKSFNQLAQLKSHLTVHEDKRKYKCKLCEKDFKRLTHLKRHLLVHDDERQYKCQICEKSFKLLCNLKTHLLVHDDKRHYQCQLCEKSFKQLCSLKRHLLVHDDKRQS